MSTKRATFLLPIRSTDDLHPATLSSIKGQDQDLLDVVVLGIGCSGALPSHVNEILPGVQYLEMPAGTRTAEALNRGLHLCETPLVAVIEPGLVLDSDWLSTLQESISDDLSVFLASGKVFLTDPGHKTTQEGDASGSGEPGAAHAPLLEAVGIGVSELGQSCFVGEQEPADDSWDFPMEIFGPHPGAVLFRRRVFSLVGPFDGAYGGGAEMVDLAFRALWQGMKTRYVPTARAYRLDDITRAEPSLAAMKADQFRLFFKCMPEPLLWLNGPRVLLRSLATWNPLRFIRNLAFLLAFLRALPGLLSRRREVLAQAQASPHYIYLKLDAADPGNLIQRLYRHAIEAFTGPLGPPNSRGTRWIGSGPWDPPEE